ncbi:MAG: sialate O-acetylesterase [Verrucomicrobiales bacterium]|jgi:sialate O-acetylesterase|nr:sialate O-acetylesterase [Verrucomicrobiales bacterium]
MKYLRLLFLFTLSISANAELRLAAIFTDHLVLQRDQPIPVWGTADAGVTVSVALGDKTATAKADAAGQWLAKLPAAPASGEPQNLTVSAGADQVTISDVLVGEVWLCSGQSNMEMSVGSALNAREEIAAAGHPQIRLLHVTRQTANSPRASFSGTWTACTPLTVRNFSAAGYFFGRELRQQLNVPVGLINASWGGTPAETWVRSSFLAGQPDYTDLLAQRDTRVFSDDKADREFLDNAERQLTDWQDKIAGLVKTAGEPEAAWFNADYQYPPAENWRPLTVPGNVESATGKRADGVFLLRKTVSLPAADADVAATLKLGPLPDYDYTWVNGRLVGSTVDTQNLNSRNTIRKYQIPAGVLRAGPNVIVIRLVNWHADCFVGQDQRFPLELTPADGQPVSLAGADWHARLETDLGLRPPDPLGGRHSLTGVLYDGMIAPLIPYGIRGAIWYQGESNAGRARQYRTLFPALIANWRQDWGEGDFPFYFVQLANFRPRLDQPAKYSEWAELREAQTLALALPNTGMAVTIDIGDAADIHPRNKQEVGRRLALNALAKTYGRDIEYSGPALRDVNISGNQVTLTFDHAGKGLVNGNQAGGPRGFAVAGADRKFYWAEATVSGDTVTVSAAEVPAPVAVRYAWADNPAADLYNADGLPASPFRTDDWPRP